MQEVHMDKNTMIEKITNWLKESDITMVRIVYHFAATVLRK